VTLAEPGAAAGAVAPGGRRRARLAGGRPHELRVVFSAPELAAVRAAAAREGLAVRAFLSAAAVAVARGAAPAAVGEGGLLMAAAGPAVQLVAAVLEAQRQVGRYGQLVNQAVVRLHATGEVGPQLQAALSACTRATRVLAELSAAGVVQLGRDTGGRRAAATGG